MKRATIDTKTPVTSDVVTLRDLAEAPVLPNENVILLYLKDGKLHRLDSNGVEMPLEPIKKTISSANAPGKPGEVCFDNNYLYICVASNTWKRLTLASW